MLRPRAVERTSAPYSTAWGLSPPPVCIRPGAPQVGLTQRARDCRLQNMDRIWLAIIVSALLLLLGASGLFVTRVDVRHPAHTVGLGGG